MLFRILIFCWWIVHSFLFNKSKSYYDCYKTILRALSWTVFTREYDFLEQNILANGQWLKLNRRFFFCISNWFEILCNLCNLLSSLRSWFKFCLRKICSPSRKCHLGRFWRLSVPGLSLVEHQLWFPSKCWINY